MRDPVPGLSGSLVLLATLTAAACSAGGESLQSQTASGRGTSPQQQVVPVTTASVEQRSMPLAVTAIGAAEAYSFVAVRAQVTGELISVNFEEGDDVQKGQVIFTLDRRPLEAALQQVQANLTRDSAQLANAQSSAARYQDLLARGIATREQADQSRTAAEALAATVEADRASVENAKVQLQYATITAPLSGRTGALMVHTGNLVRANDTTPLVVINQIAPIYVSFAIPEGQLPDLKRYLARGTVSVQAKAPNETRETSSGRITFIDNAVDQTTGTIRVKASFANNDHRLWPGQFANVTLTLTTDPMAIVVPTAAVQGGQQGDYVFIVKPDRTVEIRTVKVARTAGDQSVIADGLKPGETVVTDGQLRLVPGSTVTIKSGAGAKVTS